MRTWSKKLDHEIYPNKRTSGKECKEMTLENYSGKWLQVGRTQSLHGRRRPLAALRRKSQAIEINMYWSKARADAPELMIPSKYQYQNWFSSIRLPREVLIKPIDEEHEPFSITIQAHANLADQERLITLLREMIAISRASRRGMPLSNIVEYFDPTSDLFCYILKQSQITTSGLYCFKHATVFETYPSKNCAHLVTSKLSLYNLFDVYKYCREDSLLTLITE